MKARNKIYYLGVLLIPACSLFAVASYAQQAETTEAAEEALKMSGSGKMKIAYNSKKHPDKGSLIPALIQLSSAEDDKDKNIDATFTDVSASVDLAKTVRWEEDPIKLAVRIAISQQEAKLGKACAEFKNGVLGLQASNFGDPDSNPSSLGGGPNSAVGREALQLSFKQCINPHCSWAIGLEQAAIFELSKKYKGLLEKAEKKLAGLKDDETETAASEAEIKQHKARLRKKPFTRQPAFVVSFRCNYPSSRGHMCLGLLGRPIQYQDTQTGKTPFPSVGGGIFLGTKIQLVPKQTALKLQGVIGRGVGGYIADLASLKNEDNTAYVQVNSDDTTNLHIINAGGAHLALEHRWSSKCRSTLVISGLSIIKNQYREKDHYKEGVYGSLSLAYHPTDQFHIGIEGAAGRKTNVDGQKGYAGGLLMEAGFKF
ncbi:MAG: hypothetical protein AAF400_02790 [Bacteroidota bacterium]